MVELDVEKDQQVRVHVHPAENRNWSAWLFEQRQSNVQNFDLVHFWYVHVKDSSFWI